MKKRELTKIQKRFVLIKLISIWLPIICWVVTMRLLPASMLSTQGSVIFLTCSLAISIALCIFYLFNLKKTDGRILAITITLTVCLLLFASSLSLYIEKYISF